MRVVSRRTPLSNTVMCLYRYLRFSISVLIAIIPFISHGLTAGSFRCFSKYDYLFRFLKNIPLGLYAFVGIVSFVAPYTASISPFVHLLDRTICHASLADRPWLRNPFHSIHAVALINLGEFASGLAMITALQYQPHLRGIPVRIDTEFYRKVRTEAHAKAIVPSITDIKNDSQVTCEANIYDSSDNLVAKCTVTWSISVKSKI